LLRGLERFRKSQQRLSGTGKNNGMDQIEAMKSRPIRIMLACIINCLDDSKKMENCPESTGFRQIDQSDCAE